MAAFFICIVRLRRGAPAAARWPDCNKASAAAVRLTICWNVSPLWSAWVIDWRASFTASGNRQSHLNSLKFLATIASSSIFC